MSNRIDLTQFEEITKGTWEVTEPEWPHYGVMHIAPCSATVRRYQNDGRSEESWYANAKAIAAVPELIAELKRCYEKIDWLQQTADLATDNIGRKNWDVFEEAMYEAGLWERPSE